MLYEILKLGTIPVYIWDDIEWLPYRDFLSIDKFIISIHVSKIDQLEDILKKITDKDIENMIKEYEKVKYWFTLEGVSEYIIRKFHSLEKQKGYQTLKNMSKEELVKELKITSFSTKDKDG